jgi:cell division septation protein DedD
MFSSVFRKCLLFFYVSIFGAGYAFAAGSSDFPDVSVAAYDAGSGVARVAIDWKKVRSDDERQFGLYRSTGESADAYMLITALNTSVKVYTDSGLNVDTEYHYIIGGALPRRTLPQTQERGRKERRTELYNPQATLSYGNIPSGPIAWIPMEDSPGQPQASANPVAEDIPPPVPSNSYPQPPAQSNNYYQQPPAPSNSYQQPPAQSNNYYQQPPAQSGNYYQPPSAPSNSYQQPPAQSYNYYQQPSVPSNSYQQPPAQSHNYYQQPPAPSNSYQQPPAQSGTSYQQPSAQSGTYQQPPAQSGNYYQQPSAPSNSYQQPPAPPEDVSMPPVFPYHEPVGNFAVPAREPVFENGGVFFSMGFFSNRVFELTGRTNEPAGGPAIVSLVDGNAKSRLISLLRQSYVRSTLPGTSFFYAIHNAVNRISRWDENGALSGFDTVLLVTVTDGLDTSSTDPALAPIDGLSFRKADTYQTFIKDAIANKRVGGKKITAVSIGIRGTDTVTEQEYLTTLRAAANADENVYHIPLNNLTKVLQGVAASVTGGMAVQPFGFVTSAYPDGTEIFIALDGSSTPPRGQNFISGRIKVTGNKFTLENITLGGLAREATPQGGQGGVIGRSEPNGSIEWLFNFPKALPLSRVVLYYKTGKDWRSSREFAVRAYSPASSRHSALVYLLIDNSVSMSNQNIVAIREAATQFIEALSINTADVQPIYSSNTAFVMSRLPERLIEPELAAVPPRSQSPSSAQREKPPIPENRAEEPVQNDTEAWFRPVYPVTPEIVPDYKNSIPAPVLPSAPPQSVVEPTPQPPSVIEPTPQPQSVIEPMPQPITGGKGYWVQASSSENRNTAEEIISQLRKYQLAPVITEAQVRGKTFYRVRIGPYATLTEASTVADFVKKPPLGFYDSFVP